MVELLRRFRMNQIKLNITNIVIHSESSAIKKIHWFCFFLKNLTQKNRLRYDKHWMESELSKTNLLLSSNRNCGFSAVVMLIIPIKNYLSDDVIFPFAFHSHNKNRYVIIDGSTERFLSIHAIGYRDARDYVEFQCLSVRAIIKE